MKTGSAPDSQKPPENHHLLEVRPDPPSVELDFEAALHPSEAAGYFAAFRDLLIPVLDHHPDDKFKIVPDLRELLE